MRHASCIGTNKKLCPHWFNRQAKRSVGSAFYRVVLSPPSFFLKGSSIPHMFSIGFFPLWKRKINPMDRESLLYCEVKTNWMKKLCFHRACVGRCSLHARNLPACWQSETDTSSLLKLRFAAAPSVVIPHKPQQSLMSACRRGTTLCNNEPHLALRHVYTRRGGK